VVFTFDDPQQMYMLPDEHVDQSHAVHCKSSNCQTHKLCRPGLMPEAKLGEYIVKKINIIQCEFVFLFFKT
jgi:hypothetical protein